MTKIVRNVALVSLAATLFACGGGSGKGSRSGVAPSKTLSQATEDDVQRLCDWAQGPLRVVPTDKQLCTLIAVDEESSLRACEESVQSCLEDSDIDRDDPPLFCPFSARGFAGCDLKVADLEDCYSNKVARSRKRIARVSCSDPTGGGSRDDPTLASCKRLEDECPRIWDSSADPNGDDFECDDGSRIPRDFVCDNVQDCEFGEDEFCGGSNSTGGDSGDNGFGNTGSSGGSDFICDDGRSIPIEFVCDDGEDCFSGEDEEFCSGGSTGGSSTGGTSAGTTGGFEDGFVCRRGETIRQSWVCDGTRDCMGGEDEKTCDGGFICDDGTDISDQWKCDTRSDCSKGEDEANCP